MKTDNLMKQQFIAQASALGYGDLTRLKTTDPRRKQIITECADEYIKATKAGDEEKRNQYISALMLMFYGEIGKMAEKCKAVQDYEYDDFAIKLYECINIACDYAAWKEGKHTAEACIRSVIASRGGNAILYESNLDKNKANINKAELDRPIGDDDTTILDTIEDERANMHDSELTVESMIQDIINKGDLISAVVLDNIAFSDSTKEVKETKTGIDDDGEEYKYTTGHSEFHEYRLVQTLANLPEDYKRYFMNRYSIKEAALDATLERFHSVNNQKLYKFVRDTLAKQRAIMASWDLADFNN